MNQEQFTYLYLNATSLLDIATKQAYTDIIKDTTTATADVSTSSVDSADSGGLAGLNLDTLARLGVSSGGEAHADECLDGSGDEIETDADYDEYVPVYEEDVMQVRAAEMFSKADMPYLRRLLQQLPQGVPDLTSKLTAEQLQQWLEVNKQRNQVLTELLQYLRRVSVDSDAVSVD